MFALSLGSLQIKLLADTSQYTKALRGAQVLLDTTSKKMTSVGRSMSLYITTPLTAIGGASIRAFGNFDDAMTKSLAIMGNVGPEMRKEMENVALTISEKSVTSAKNLADSYYFLASAGMNAAQSVKALPVVEKFAVAGAFDMALATDLLTDAQSALGLSSKDAEKNMQGLLHVSDVLTKANTLANASTQLFSESLTNEAGAAIKNFNMDLEEGVSILAAYADQGVKGDVAGSMFARMTRLLIKSINENGKEFKKLNIDVEEFGKTGKNLTGVIEGITKAVDGMGPAEKAATLETLGFEARIQQAILPLLGATEKMRGYRAELDKAGGITEEVANKQLASFNSQMKILWNQIVNVGIEIGRTLAPWVTRLSEYVKDGIRWWKGLSENTRNWIMGIAAVAAAAGPLLIVLGMVAGAISNIITVLSTLSLASVTWIALAGLIVVAAGLVADAFFNAQTGFLDFVYSIRVGGLKIETWITSIAVAILKAWEWVYREGVQIWETLKIAVLYIGEAILRAYLSIGKAIVDAFFWVAQRMMDSFAWMVEKSLKAAAKLGLIDEDELNKSLNLLDRLKQGMEDVGKSASDVFQNEINASLKQSAKDWDSYVQGIDQSDKDYEEAIRALNEVEQKAIERDVAEQMKGLEEVKKDAEKIMSSAPTQETPEVAKTVSEERMKNEFQQVSLRRFALDGVAAGAKKEKQEVKDPILAAKLDTLTQVVREKKAAAFG